MGNTLHGNLALSREQLSQENGDAYFPTGETSNDPSNNYPDATNDESFTNTPFLDRLKGEKVRGSITVPNNQGMGVFSVKQRGEKPSGAANLMKSRISAQPMNTTGNTRFVGSELKPNQTLQEQAARMARDAELWRAALSLGVNCYRDGNGELVFEMPKNIIAEIEEKANEKANYQLESSKLTIKNEVLERFKSLSKYTIRFALLQERAKKIASTEGNQKDISTLQWMLDTASKENPSNEEVTLTLIENNLAALEENIAQGESVVAEQEAARSREEQEQAANLIHEKEAALKAQKEAEETLAKERTLHQAERKLLEEFASLYASFLETESRSRKLRPSLDEKIGESLTEAARELNILKPELIRKPSEEILSTWKEKLTAFTSFVDSLEKTLTGTNPSEQNNESFSPLTIHSGWPSNIKTDNGNWLLIKKDGASVTLDNNALWSTLASHFDDTFKTYQNFFEGNDANQKIKNYHLVGRRWSGCIY